MVSNILLSSDLFEIHTQILFHEITQLHFAPTTQRSTSRYFQQLSNIFQSLCLFLVFLYIKSNIYMVYGHTSSGSSVWASARAGHFTSLLPSSGLRSPTCCHNTIHPLRYCTVICARSFRWQHEPINKKKQGVLIGCKGTGQAKKFVFWVSLQRSASHHDKNCSDLLVIASE